MIHCAPRPRNERTPFQKWKVDLDHECQTMSWLDCDTELDLGTQKVVRKLRCSVCTKFKANIASRRNFSEKWLCGADSLRTSNIKDHAKADQHVHAMNLLKRERAKQSGCEPSSYAPIAASLSKLPEAEHNQLQHKFDIAYFIAVEKILFKKYPKLCKLEARHGVAIGSAYTNEIAGKTFTHYIAESQRLQLFEAKYFSILMDGSTDKGNIEDEVFMVVWCDVTGVNEKISTRTTFFHVNRPNSADAAGLFQSLQTALLRLGMSELNERLVGTGSDGAAANVAKGVLRG